MSFLLLQIGDDLLLQNGDKLLLQADTGEVSAMALRIQTEGLYVGSHA